MKTKKFNAADFFGRFGIVIILILLCIFFTTKNSSFISVNNIINILRQVAINGIIAVGMTMVLITGGIDLSVGSVVGVGTVFCGLMLVNGVPWFLALLACLVIGFLVGIFNAFLICRLNLPPLIATLGSMTSLRGVCYLVTNGSPVFGFPEDILFLGKGTVFGIIPVPVILMIIVFILGILFLQKTRFGTYIYGIGGNEEASRLSGINTKRIKYICYGVCSALAALAGVVLLARVNSGQPKSGDGYEMDVITACVLGGVSISGGEGKLSFVIFGVLLMGVLSNGLIMINVSDYWQQAISGLVLIAAVAFDRLMQHLKAKRLQS